MQGEWKLKAQQRPGAGMCVTEVPARSTERPGARFLRRASPAQRAFLLAVLSSATFRKMEKIFFYQLQEMRFQTSLDMIIPVHTFALSRPCWAWVGLEPKEQGPGRELCLEAIWWHLGYHLKLWTIFLALAIAGHSPCPALDSERYSDLPPATAEWRTVGNRISTWKGIHFPVIKGKLCLTHPCAIPAYDLPHSFWKTDFACPSSLPSLSLPAPTFRPPHTEGEEPAQALPGSVD